MTMQYKMLAIDLDGTLLDTNGEIPAKNLSALHAAREAGLVIIPCTGRSYRESLPVLESFKHAGIGVFTDGAMVVDCGARHTVSRTRLTTEVAASIAECISAAGGPVLILTDVLSSGLDYLLIGHEKLDTTALDYFTKLNLSLRRLKPGEAMEAQDILKVGTLGSWDLIAGCKEALVERFGNHITQRVFEQHFAPSHGRLQTLEVFNCRVNKWHALSAIAGEMGVTAPQIAAIGDSVNDVMMVRNAGCGIAMKNARNEVTRVATRYTLSNDDGGVAWAIHKLLDGSW